MDNSNKLDKLKEVPVDIITPRELLTMKYSRPLQDMVQCPKCNWIISREDNTEEWGLDDVDFEVMNYDDFDDITADGISKIQCPHCRYVDYANKFKTAWTDDIVDAPNANEIVPGISNAYEKLNSNKGVEETMSLNNKNKLTLQEATIKALYDGLKDNDTVADVEGLVDNVLVVTDPEITTSEYTELIDRAQEIVEDTPEGDIPFDPTYLGEYLQICPICGGSFIEDHIFEPGTACPICYEIPESFVLIGQVQSEQDVAEDNGIANTDEIADENNDTNIVVDDAIDNSDVDEDTTDNNDNSETIEKPVDNIDTESPRGARVRRLRDVASKQLSSGNILTEQLNEAIDTEVETSSKEYTIESVDADKIKSLADNSAFTWIGMDTSDENLQAIVDDLKENTNIVLPIKFYTWKGSVFNEMNDLTGKVAYPDDLSFLAIDLDNWSNPDKLPIYKIEYGAHWLDDVIDNDKTRQFVMNEK